MSIDARIAGITIKPDGVFLNLEKRDRYTPAGQTRMEILNPPADPKSLSPLVGEEIWGDSSSLMMGNTKFATREGYTKLRLLEAAK